MTEQPETPEIQTDGSNSLGFAQMTGSERILQQAEWFKQGQIAAAEGQQRRDWPRSAIKYGIEWYARKTAWQAGWSYYRHELSSEEVLPYLSPEEIIANTSKSDRVVDMLFRIVNLAPIAKRRLIAEFSSKHRRRVKLKIQELIDRGIFEQTGKGVKEDPYLIRVKPVETPKLQTVESNEGVSF